MDVSDEKIREYFEARARYNESELDIPELTLKQKFDLQDAMYEHSVEMGIWPPDDPLEGIEEKIQLAKMLHSVSKDP